LVDLPPIAMECAFMRMFRSSRDLETFFLGIWQIWASFFMENSLYKLRLYFSALNLAKFPPKQKRWFGG
jgi:hypothetical protein